MTIFIDKDLPAFDILKSEGRNIGINPIHNQKVYEIGILNLMPNKADTETHLIRALSDADVEARITWLSLDSHVTKNTSPEHMAKFYQSWKTQANRRFDGLISTGASIDHLPFEDVTYWSELKEYLDWSDEATLDEVSICWSAMGRMNHNHGIEKEVLEKKIFGVYDQSHTGIKSKLMQNFSNAGEARAPVGRIARVNPSEISKAPNIKVLLQSDITGVSLAVENKGNKQIVYIFDHPEYEAHTLDAEYNRDLGKGELEVAIPENYYPNNDPSQPPKATWLQYRSLYSNWLNAVAARQESPQEQTVPTGLSGGNLVAGLHPLR